MAGEDLEVPIKATHCKVRASLISQRVVVDNVWKRGKMNLEKSL